MHLTIKCVYSCYIYTSSIILKCNQRIIDKQFIVCTIFSYREKTYETAYYLF